MCTQFGDYSGTVAPTEHLDNHLVQTLHTSTRIGWRGLNSEIVLVLLLLQSDSSVHSGTCTVVPIGSAYMGSSNLCPSIVNMLAPSMVSLCGRRKLLVVCPWGPIAICPSNGFKMGMPARS